MSDDNDKRKQLDDKLSEVFGINFDTKDTDNLPAEVVEEKKTKEIAKALDDKLEQDFERSREALIELLQQSQDAIEYYMEICKVSDSPRAFEVLAKLLDTSANLSKDALNIHQTVKTVKEVRDEEPAGSMNIQNANILVGTTADIQKQLEKDDE